jgi:hypothetical protein
MSHLWPDDWFNITPDEEVLKNIGSTWAKKGYDTLDVDDYVRLEPFLEPFDGIYTETEKVILSRTGNNGVQKQFCSMFITKDDKDQDLWVLEWHLPKGELKRNYLKRVSVLLYGSSFDNDETQCMIMLTHALSSLRQLKIIVKGDKIYGEIEEVEPEYVDEQNDVQFMPEQ